jgi:predicted transcriptional regulator
VLQEDDRTYRSTPEIYFDILSGIQEHRNAKPTHIMFYARLPYANLQRKLKTLVNKGLLQTDGKTYNITSEGSQYIRIYRLLKVNLKETD